LLSQIRRYCAFAYKNEFEFSQAQYLHIKFARFKVICDLLRGEGKLMARFKTIWLFITLVITAFTAAIGAKEPAPMAVESKGPEQNPTNVELSKPIVGPVHSARAALGTEISQGDAPVGKIEDLSLDLGSGTVQGVYFRPIKPVDDKQDTMLMQMSHFQWPDDSGKVTMAGMLEQKSEKLQDNKNSPTKTIMLSKSASIRVLDGKGQSIGHVVDFGLSRKQGKVAYAVLHLGHSDNEKDADIGKHEKVYPVPLAAFLIKDGSTDWTLDLPAKMLDELPSFKETETWPRVVAGTWTEYIHVRYGRSVLGGVQIEAKKFDDGGKTNPREGVKKQY
jgi:sporulation protein YlmC with PRC-barrel domain